MKIKLLKPIHRETLSVSGTKRRNMIVSLIPGDVIQFRAKGTRKRFEVYLGHCFILAQIMEAQSEYMKKLKEYNDKKKMGMRAKRPKKPFMPYSKMYFDAIK